MTRMRAVLTMTIDTEGDYYVDHDDLIRNVTLWIEGSLDDRDDIRNVTITAQPEQAREVLGTTGEQPDVSPALARLQAAATKSNRETAGYTLRAYKRVYQLARNATGPIQPDTILNALKDNDEHTNRDRARELVEHLGITVTGEQAAAAQPEPAVDRRARYAAAIRETSGWVLDDGQHMIDAVMAVADSEITAALRATGEQPDATQPEPTEEQIVREHVTTVHLIGDQLAGVESWLWERLADIRAAEHPDAGPTS